MPSFLFTHMFLMHLPADVCTNCVPFASSELLMEPQEVGR